MRSMATSSVSYSKSKVRGQKHPREVVKNRNSIPNTSKDCQHPVLDNQCPRRGGHHRPSPISRHIITCYVRYQGSKYTVIYIYIYIGPMLAPWTLLSGICYHKHIYSHQINQLDASPLKANNLFPLWRTWEEDKHALTPGDCCEDLSANNIQLRIDSSWCVISEKPKGYWGLNLYMYYEIIVWLIDPQEM